MKTNSSAILNQQIMLLEEKKEKDLIALKQHIQVTGKSLKPSNLMKNAMQHIANDQEVRSAVKKAVIGLILGIATEKILALKPGSKSKGLAGIAMNIGFNLLLSGRYKLIKTVGALVVGAIVFKVKTRKERKRLAAQEAEVLAPVIS